MVGVERWIKAGHDRAQWVIDKAERQVAGIARLTLNSRMLSPLPKGAKVPLLDERIGAPPAAESRITWASRWLAASERALDMAAELAEPWAAVLPGPWLA
jgi:hypothetical protein